MGLLDFLKDAGENLFKGGADEGEQIKSKIEKDLGSNVSLSRVSFNNGRVELHGEAKSVAAKEKAALIAGNVRGVNAVSDDGLRVAGAASGSGMGAPSLGTAAARANAPAAARTQYYTIQSGDSLSKIAKEKYGEMDKWQALFAANKEVIQDPDKIYPGPGHPHSGRRHALAPRQSEPKRRFPLGEGAAFRVSARQAASRAAHHSTRPPRSVHAAVRRPLVATSRPCAAASNPADSVRCSGTCSKAVLAQTTPTSASPTHTDHAGSAAGRCAASQSAVSSSAVMSGSTIHVMRRACSASYAANPPAPTPPNSG